MQFRNIISRMLTVQNKKSPKHKAEYYPQLDGWRAISICLVLAAHLLPLGPKAWKGNVTAALSGMVIFFNLSGFLIVSFLKKRPEFWPFLVRRFLRILPLAWTTSAVLLIISQGSVHAWIANFLFLLNYQKQFEWAANAHFWSLCVEMHFYLGVAILVLLGGKKALWILPFVGLGITINRVLQGVTYSGYTHLRADEILAGATMALLLPYSQHRVLRHLLRLGPVFWLVILFISSNVHSGGMLYVRPYAGMLAVFSSLVHPECRFSKLIGSSNILAYLAKISYAVYILHIPLRTGWFAEGSKIEVYLLKRPITVALTFFLAHFSTFYWEAFWIRLGYRLTSQPKNRSCEPTGESLHLDKNTNTSRLPPHQFKTSADN